jgi:maleylpyruvate isomerase
VKLYGYWRSSSSWRVRIALNLKGLAYEYVPVNLIKNGGEQFGPAHTERNPLQQVPVLEWEHQGAPRRLAQSVAIIEHLDELHPEPPLLPRDPWERAQARMLAEHVNSGIQPMQNAAVLRYLKELQPDSDKGWLAHWIGRGLVGLEGAMKATAGKHAVGDTLTIADVYLIPQLYSARRFGIDLAPFPTLTRVEQACEALPAFAAAHADRQPDAPAPEKR